MVLFLGILLFGSCQNQSNQQTVADESSTNLGEKHRPKFHFTPAEKWMNDPNGMVFYEDEYHLFYQYYPEDIVWGPMHWGHAVSKDLVNWEHLPIALYPDSLGYIFSGSAVIDWENTSGLGTDGRPPMIAIFTHHDPVGEKAGTKTFQYQSLAYSNDYGRSWTKYTGNPIIPNPGIRDFRDPKVIWDEARSQWVMVFAAWDHVKIYTSENLIDWDIASDFGRDMGTHAGVWECPDLFPLTVAGTNEVKWVLLVSINPGAPNGGSGTQYFVGDFNGKTFMIDNEFSNALGTLPAVEPDGDIFADFEENRYTNWEKTGFAFGNYPATGKIADQEDVLNFRGERLVNTYFNGNETEGVIKSPTFKINHRYINFLMGGGMHSGKVGMSLNIDGNRVVKSATGNNSETLSWQSWDVSGFMGQNAHLRIFDQYTGSMGHILVDQITFSDEAARPETEKAVWLDYGRDNYAGVTWSDIPKTDGRRIFMGWMSNWAYAQDVPTQNWRSAMTIPREVKLVKTGNGLRVISTPVIELEKLRGGQTELNGASLNAGPSGPHDLFEGIAEIELILTLDDEDAVELEFSNEHGEKMLIGIDRNAGIWYTDRRMAGLNDFSTVFALGRHTAPIQQGGSQHTLRIFLDVASIELFANQGQTVMSDVFFPSAPMTSLTISGTGQLDGGTVYDLKGASFETAK